MLREQTNSTSWRAYHEHMHYAYPEHPVFVFAEAFLAQASGPGSKGNLIGRAYVCETYWPWLSDDGRWGAALGVAKAYRAEQFPTMEED